MTPSGEHARYLVPDVAHLSYERLPADERDAAEEPHVAPDVAVEIRPPSDLRAGTTLVVLIDPIARTCVLHDAERQTVLAETQILHHAALPEFALEPSSLFAELDA